MSEILEMPRCRSFGGFLVGELALAIPMFQLIEAVPVDTLVPLAADSPLVVGGLRLREHVIPVVDLEVALGRTEPSAPIHHVVIVTHEGRAIGLACQAITDVFEPDHVTRTAGATESSSGTLLEGYVMHTEAEHVYAVIDVSRLLDEVPLAIDSERGLRSAASDFGNAFAAADRCVLLRAGGQAFALSTKVVQSIHTFDALQPTPYAGGACLGKFVLAGRDLPAIDLLTLTRAPGAVHEGSGHAIVVATEHGSLALIADAVLDIAPLPSHAISPVQCPKDRAGWLVAGAFPSAELHGLGLAPTVLDHERYLIVDEDRMLATPQLQNLAALDSFELEKQDREVTTNPPGAGVTVLCYHATSHIATPLDQVTEILELPTIFDVHAHQTEATPILMSRGRAVTLFTIEDLLGLPLQAGRRHALVVETPTGRVGFSVGALGGIEVSEEQHELPDHILADGNLRELTGGRCIAIPAARAGRQKLLPRIDLVELAARASAHEDQDESEHGKAA